MKDLVTLDDYKRAGFIGVDANLATSLYEYGFIYKVLEDAKAIQFIYGVGYDGEKYCLFDHCTYPLKDIKDLRKEPWIRLKDVRECAGVAAYRFKRWHDYTNFVYDLVSYHGWINVFGESYYPFKIEQ